MHYISVLLLIFSALALPSSTLASSNLLHITSKIGYETTIDMGECTAENIYKPECSTQLQALEYTRVELEQKWDTKLNSMLEKYLKNPNISIEQKLQHLPTLHQVLHNGSFLYLLANVEGDYTKILNEYLGEKESLRRTFKISDNLLEKVNSFIKDVFDQRVVEIPAAVFNKDGEVTKTYLLGYFSIRQINNDVGGSGLYFIPLAGSANDAGNQKTRVDNNRNREFVDTTGSVNNYEDDLFLLECNNDTIPSKGLHLIEIRHNIDGFNTIIGQTCNDIGYTYKIIRSN